MKESKRSMHLRAFLHVAPLSAVALLSAGWTNTLNRPTSAANTASMQADSQYMSRKFQARANPSADAISIDLADPVQFRYVTNRLKASGKTPENSPYLYERLNQSRQRALTKQASNKPGDVTTTDTPAGQWCNHFLYLGNETGGTTTTQYTLTPVVACDGGANYVYTDVLAYNSNASGTDNIPVDSAAGEDYSGGTNFVGDLTLHPSIPTTNNRFLTAESMMIAMDEDTGAEQYSYSEMKSAATPVKQGITLFHPREVVGGDGSDIWMCQLRGGGDCDYAVSGYQNGVLQAYAYPYTGIAGARPDGSRDPNAYWPFTSPYNHNKIYLPLKGTYDAGALSADCRITRYESAKLRLQMQLKGKVCYVETDFLNQLTTGSKTASFNFLADFTNAGSGSADCNKETIINEPVALWMQVKAWADCGNGEKERFTSTTSDNKPVLTRKLFYVNSCMAEGTGILRADGSNTPIEQLKVGDKVVANDRGLVLTVTDIAHGGENKPLVRVKDSKGHDVRFTEQHPVLTASGKVVPAVSLKVKDRVRTQGGTATITAIERIPYDGQVYNLNLGTPEELAKLGPNDRTMFAGGLLVGDNTMQAELERPKQKPVDVLASLPKAWHKDYKNRLDVKSATVR
jgi:hypothetical protein